MIVLNDLVEIHSSPLIEVDVLRVELSRSSGEPRTKISKHALHTTNKFHDMPKPLFFKRGPMSSLLSSPSSPKRERKQGRGGRGASRRGKDHNIKENEKIDEENQKGSKEECKTKDERELRSKVMNQKDKNQQLANSDDLRNYAYEGEGSTPTSLSSCCSGKSYFLIL